MKILVTDATGYMRGAAEGVAPPRPSSVRLGALGEFGDRTESFTLDQMFRSAGSGGISLSLNKRLSTEKTRQITGWSPSRTDILHEVEFDSYAF
jgi:hypothetical protein